MTTSPSQPNAQETQPPAVLLDILQMAASNQKHFELAHTFGFAQMTPESGGKYLPFDLAGKLSFEETGFLIAGEITGEIKQQCDRCGQTFDREVSHRVKERFVFKQLEALNEGTEREWALGELYEVHDPNNPFNLTAFVEESLIMALSYDRICDNPDCQPE